MEINACVKNREPSFYFKNYNPIALLFKDKGGLVNHPLSCHPQGVFGSRESVKKGEKMKERKIGGRAESFRIKILLHNVMIVCIKP